MLASKIEGLAVEASGWTTIAANAIGHVQVAPIRPLRSLVVGEALVGAERLEGRPLRLLAGRAVPLLEVELLIRAVVALGKRERATALWRVVEAARRVAARLHARWRRPRLKVEAALVGVPAM